MNSALRSYSLAAAKPTFGGRRPPSEVDFQKSSRALLTRLFDTDTLPESPARVGRSRQTACPRAKAVVERSRMDAKNATPSPPGGAENATPSAPFALEDATPSPPPGAGRSDEFRVRPTDPRPTASEHGWPFCSSQFAVAVLTCDTLKTLLIQAESRLSSAEATTAGGPRLHSPRCCSRPIP